MATTRVATTSRSNSNNSSRSVRRRNSCQCPQSLLPRRSSLRACSPSGSLGCPRCTTLPLARSGGTPTMRIVHHRGERGISPDSCSSSSGPLGPETSLLAARSSSTRCTTRFGAVDGYSVTSSSSSSRGTLQLRKLSGCYECHAISEPRRYPTPRTLSSCPECGEVFTKAAEPGASPGHPPVPYRSKRPF